MTWSRCGPKTDLEAEDKLATKIASRPCQTQAASLEDLATTDLVWKILRELNGRNLSFTTRQCAAGETPPMDAIPAERSFRLRMPILMAVQLDPGPHRLYRWWRAARYGRRVLLTTRATTIRACSKPANSGPCFSDLYQNGILN